MNNDSMKNPDAVKNFFEEARRLSKLNKGKQCDDDGLTPSEKVGAWTVGILVAALFLIPFTAAVTAYTIFAYGFVAVKLWAWFVMPVFGVKALTLLQAVGIFILIKLATYTPKLDGDVEQKTSAAIGKVIGALLTPWISLLMGYIVYRLM